jgi:peptidyl-dipeptidase A
MDSTSEMVKQNWTVEQMFHVTDKFITDLGLLPMPQEFWNKSMFSKPKDRPVMCQPTSLDLYNHKDFR